MFYISSLRYSILILIILYQNSVLCDHRVGFIVSYALSVADKENSVLHQAATVARKEKRHGSVAYSLVVAHGEQRTASRSLSLRLGGGSEVWEAPRCVPKLRVLPTYRFKQARFWVGSGHFNPFTLRASEEGKAAAAVPSPFNAREHHDRAAVLSAPGRSMRKLRG